jgi:hypothetical protein
LRSSIKSYSIIQTQPISENTDGSFDREDSVTAYHAKVHLFGKSTGFHSKSSVYPEQVDPLTLPFLLEKEVE